MDDHEEEGIAKDRVLHFSNQKAQNNIDASNSVYSRGSMAKDRNFSGGAAINNFSVATHQKTSSLSNGPLSKLGGNNTGALGDQQQRSRKLNSGVISDSGNMFENGLRVGPTNVQTSTAHFNNNNNFYR